MARQIIKLGELVKTAWSKVNANFQELYNAIATIPTKTSQLTNDSGFLTEHQDISGKVDKVFGKGLSTNDYTTAEKNKLAGLSAPSKLTFTASNWGTAGSDGYYTYQISSTRYPVRVMKKNGTTYEEVIIQANTTGSAIVLTSEEAFEGYVLTA